MNDIRINLDERCRRCGKRGTVNDGSYCLDCISIYFDRWVVSRNQEQAQAALAATEEQQ